MYEERRTTVEHESVVPETDPYHEHASDTVVHDSRVYTARPSTATVVARIVTIVFGLIQLVIGLRIIFLAIGARQGNEIVAGILSLSQPLVAPFEGMLSTDALHGQGAMLDLSAIVALVGWTIVELIVLAIIRVAMPSERV